jgi:autotransporter-associated beta strand protein
VNNQRRSIPFVARIALAAFVGLGVLPASAQTWTGAGPNDNWSTGANWSGGVPPASSPATQVTFPDAARLTPVVDTPWTVNRITFASLANYALGGQPITLDGASAAIVVAQTSFPRIANPIVLAAPAIFGSVTGSMTVDGPISGPGSLTVSTGPGGVSLTAASTYTGGTTILVGTLGLHGSIVGPVSVETFGTLFGEGTVNGPVTLIGPEAALSPDPVLSTGNLTMQAGTGLEIGIRGPTQGSQYSTANVTGSVDISGSTLSLVEIASTYAPVPGDIFTIIANDGTDPVIGTFAGLPEGATVTFNGVPLRISYVGGTGNDVTLTALAAVAATDVRQVPTLSEWALLLLVSLMLGLGMRRARRRP